MARPRHASASWRRRPSLVPIWAATSLAATILSIRGLQGGGRAEGPSAAHLQVPVPTAPRRGTLLGALLGTAAVPQSGNAAVEEMPMEMIQRPHSSQMVEGKRRRKFPDFQLTGSGLQVKDVDMGRVESPYPSVGDSVVLSWEGYTVNFKGLPFETRKLQEVARVEAEPLRFKVGDGSVVPGIDEAVRSMREGGIRQVIVPVELGYDADKRLRPWPSTFSGQRTLNFVLDNTGGVMDKTLLFNVKLRRIYKD